MFCLDLEKGLAKVWAQGDDMFYDHTNVIAGIDVGTEGSYKYFVMEYAEGPTVGQLLERGGALDEKRAISIAIQVARALDHAHQNGFVHRDIKPANIILTVDGVAKLCGIFLGDRTRKAADLRLALRLFLDESNRS